MGATHCSNADKVCDGLVTMHLGGTLQPDVGAHLQSSSPANLTKKNRAQILRMSVKRLTTAKITEMIVTVGPWDSVIVARLIHGQQQNREH